METCSFNCNIDYKISGPGDEGSIRRICSGACGNCEIKWIKMGSATGSGTCLFSDVGEG